MLSDVSPRISVIIHIWAAVRTDSSITLYILLWTSSGFKCMYIRDSLQLQLDSSISAWEEHWGGEKGWI